MTVHIVRRDGVEIAYETFGSSSGEPLLLVMGMGGQVLTWHPEFCAALVDRGFQVCRFDNRDAGMSTRFTSSGPPNQLLMWLRPAAAAAYRLEDMADDAVAVIEANGWISAHLVGVSQGGMIAQVMAGRHPDKVRSLTSISSAPAARIGQPGLRTLLRLARIVKRPVTDAESFTRQMLELRAFAGSPAVPPTTHGRANSPHNVTNAATTYTPSSVRPPPSPPLATVAPHCPHSTSQTLVIHGEADQLIRPHAGRETASSIPGAKFVSIPGMGHDLPRQVWPTIIDEIRGLTQHAARSGS